MYASIRSALRATTVIMSTNWSGPTLLVDVAFTAIAHYDQLV